MKRPESPLIAAASQLDEALAKFEKLADAAAKGPIDSQKALERTAKALREVADMDDLLGARVKALVEAITRAREQQQQQALAVQTRAKELEARTAVFEKLMERYAQLGGGATEINTLVQGVAATKQEGDGPNRFDEVLERIDALVALAEQVSKEAEAAEFRDIGHTADSLRQQLLSARNKMALLAKSLEVRA